MLIITIAEYERVYYADAPTADYREGTGWYVPRRLLERLHSFELRRSRSDGCMVFDWTARDFVKATSQVGVIQVPGLTVEILPKIDKPSSQTDDDHCLAQGNLLYMLSLARYVPLSERDLAHLSKQKMPLLDALVSIFVERLLQELLRGVDHTYVRREENLPCLKGKLLISQHIRHNAAHQELVYVGYDDFVADTWLNRTIKTACRKLIGMTALPRVQKRLREALAHLDDVADCTVGIHDFPKVHFSRNTERFRPIFEFCCMVIAGESPTVSSGQQRSFSLLFPMEKLFEDFIAAVLCKDPAFFDLSRQQIHVQAKGKQKYLLRKPDNSGMFRLKPDILIEGDVRRETRLIVDTKWKHLKTSDVDPKNGVNQSDVYQLYAYAHRYRCGDNILLYPKVLGVDSQRFTIDGDGAALHDGELRIEQVCLSRNLLNACERKEFRLELKQVLWPGRRRTARSTDWKIESMPAEHVVVPLGICYSKNELTEIAYGLIPQVMEEKWFVYYDRGMLNFHRSWTGYCVYRVFAREEGSLMTFTHAEVNRHPKQYKETDDEHDRKMIPYLIDVLLLKKPSNYPEKRDDFNGGIQQWAVMGKTLCCDK